MSKSNLSRLISPGSIAVVGHRGADFAIKGSLKLGYTGKIWAIHPSRETIEGLECYKSVRDLPEPCLLYTSPSPRDKRQSRMPSSA